MKDLQNPILRFAVKIDQKIAARDQIELGKRRVVQKVMRREQNALADFFFDAKTRAFLDKKSLETFSRNVCRYYLVVHAFAGSRDGFLVDVARKDLDCWRV